MKVIVCDDDPHFAEKVKSSVEVILLQNKIEADFCVCQDPACIYNAPGFYDMAFLDIEMPGYSGIDVAKKLKLQNPYIIIFVITSYDQYLDDAMDIDVFRYINKPLDLQRLTGGINKALERIDSTVLDCMLKGSSGIKKVQISDIVYVEIKGRHTEVVTVSERFDSEESIEFWESKLTMSFFYRIHKSYIVNMKHITEYRRDTVGVSSGDTLPVSYRKQTAFRQFFFDYFGD